MTRILKPEFQELSDEFESVMEGRGCSCHLNSPCSFCTHEGNPLNLEETDEAWEEVDDYDRASDFISDMDDAGHKESDFI